MKKFITEEMFKQIVVNASSLVIAIGICIIFWNLPIVLTYARSFISIVYPFILGLAFAFILYRPQMWLEKQVMKLKVKISKSKIRIFTAIAVFLLTILLFVLVIGIMIPAIVSSTQIFAANIGIYGNTLYKWIISVADKLNISTAQLDYIIQQLDLSKRITQFLTGLLPKLAVYSYSFVMGAFKFFLAIVAGLYILIDHENLQRTFKKLTFATLDFETSEILTTWIIDAKTIFQKYIVGSLFDSLIIGGITYFFVLFMKMPYPPLIGIIIGMTNIIPVFGPFLGSIPVAFLLLLIKPVYALIFLIFITVLQQIDGNVVKPIILGDQLGISGFWILFSVTVGGGLFGIIGMFLGVPVFALLYQSLKRITDRRLYKKKIQIDKA